jgi:negative regulator of sigma-B (phosphoserine phosphatase)
VNRSVNRPVPPPPRPVAANVAFLCQPADGEIACGDAVVVRRDAEATLLAVVDVLGHGPEAGRVAAQAVKFLETAPLTRALALVQGLHDALRGTRGAAVALCVLRGFQLDACGVGNVETRVLGTKIPVISTPGIVGARIGILRESLGRLATGDRVVCWSDGITTRLELDAVRHLPPPDACARIMTQHRRRHDDASILVADVGRTTEAR